MLTAKAFQHKVLSWYDIAGRHDLPWQKNQTPYTVWVSEIMLQQTQVVTVIPYFRNFMKSFATVERLAASEIDTVLSHWSGLGYYARARNLHRSAVIIQTLYSGQFPKTVEALVELPGIGRSTAGAILSLSENIFAPILDGNVKRVLSRFFTIEGWPNSPKTQKKLWQLSETLTPHTRCRDYNQAMMDLGATICTRSQPKCAQCPLKNNCLAKINGNVNKFPHKKAPTQKPVKQLYLLILERDNGEILLQKRPPSGIWGGLWSFPETQNPEEITTFCQQQFHCNTRSVTPLEKFKHNFTHFSLEIQPLLVKVRQKQNSVMESSCQVWYNISGELPGGIPSPIKKIIHLHLNNIEAPA